MPLYRRIEPGLQILNYEYHSFDEMGLNNESGSVIRRF